MKMSVRAFAKLNLSLDILSRLPDGYHEMRMVMQSAALYDDITISVNGNGEFRAPTNLGYLPPDDRNIAARAAKRFFEETGMEGCGAEIEISKRIPVCAGLGGGSSDGAAVLRGLNRLTGAGLSAGRLIEMARPLGSDVPFCVRGGTALATGRGDDLESLPPLPDCYVVICKPPFSISTPSLFRRMDCGKIKNRPDTEGMISALRAGDLGAVARRVYNVFEDFLPKKFGEIAVIKGKLLEYGALGAAMSGSGSAVFGIFGYADTAETAAARLSEDYPDCFSVRVLGELDIMAGE